MAKARAKSRRHGPGIFLSAAILLVFTLVGYWNSFDVPLVFGNLTTGQTAMLIGEPTPEAEALSAQMRAAWTAFATAGDPGWAGFETGATRLFDTTPSVGEYPERVSREIWQDPPGVLDLVSPGPA